MTSPFPALVVWPVGLTHCPWPSPLVPASLDGFYSGRSLDGEPPPMTAREVVSSACSHSSQAMGSSRREGRDRERSGMSREKSPFPAPSQPEGAGGWMPLERGERLWAVSDRDLCPNPTLCVFSCQGTCCLQHPGCCPHCSCHLPATGGDGTLGGRRVPLLLQVSLASLPTPHT